jgi:hypothetical protein
MRKLLVALLMPGLLSAIGCDYLAKEEHATTTTTTTLPPRTFSEKVQCATVGERWEKAICANERGKTDLMCGGWWAYNAKRDTCVGVFLVTSIENRQTFQTLSVTDLLTGVALEPPCGAAHCDAESAKARWILGQDG